MGKSKKQTKADSRPAMRKDGWTNATTGIGIALKDKRLNTKFRADVLSRDQLEAIWRGSDIAARIIETVPDEMVREGFDLRIQPDEPAPGPGEPPADETPPEAINPGEEKNPGEDPAAKPGEDPALKAAETSNPNGAPPSQPAADPNAAKETSAPVPPDPNAPPTKPGESPPPEDPKKKKVDRMDAFPPGKGGPPGAFGAPPPPKPPPGIINRPDDEPREQAEQVMAQCEELGVLEKFHEGLKYERAYGGGAIFVGADDGLAPNQPLAMENIRTVKWLNVLTPRELVPVQYYSDPQAPKYGEVEIYRIQRETMPVAPQNTPARSKTQSLFSSVEVHESRLIIFSGIKVSRLQVVANMAPGWGDSVLVRCNRVMADFDLAWASAAILLQEFAPAVLKMQNLADLIANNEDAVVINRALALAMSKSTAGITLIDKEEEYDRQTTPITGLPEMLEKFCTRLAASADMPVTLLMGQAPAGLNATGASDIRFFYDKIKSRQKNRLMPQLKRLIKMIMLAKEGPLKGKEPKNWTIEFRPLWQLTELEQADLRLKQAQIDKIELDGSVVTPEEVAASRHGGDQWSSKTTVDFEGRKTMAAEHETAMADHQKQTEKTMKLAAKGKLPGADPNAPPEPFGKKDPPGEPPKAPVPPGAK